MIIKSPKQLRTFVDFPLFLSTSPLSTPVELWFRTFLKRFRTLQNSSELFFSTYPCWNIKVLNFLNLGTHRERYIKRESNIKLKSFQYKPSKLKLKIDKEHISEFSFDSKFLNAICPMVAVIAATLGGLT